MTKIKIAAPAKINLHLRIGDRRPDGFHDIESLFLALDFGDTLRIETLPDAARTEGALAGTEIHMDWRLPHGPKPIPQLPPEKNIVSQAVSLFRKRTGYGKRLRIDIEKRIPLGGGLGGGSSNAASTLLALNRLASPDPKGLLSRKALAEMGEALGSDVPFFVYETTAAWVSGRGERVQPIRLPEGVRSLPLLLVNPGFHSDTAGAFRLLDEYRQAAPRRALAGSGSFSPDNLPGIFASPPQDWPFSNDFLAVFEALQPPLPNEPNLAYHRKIIPSLRKFGANFAGLSGSGSTCFGIFLHNSRANFAKKLLLKHWPCVFETFCLHISH